MNGATIEMLLDNRSDSEVVKGALLRMLSHEFGRNMYYSLRCIPAHVRIATRRVRNVEHSLSVVTQVDLPTSWTALYPGEVRTARQNTKRIHRLKP